MTAALVILRGEFSDLAAYALFAAAGLWIGRRLPRRTKETV